MPNLMRRLCLAVGLLAPCGALAQDVPPGNAVPNYDRIPIGQREGLESGAFIARTDDAGAPWYNPAGLVQSERSGINASANAYELISVTLESDSRRQQATRFSPRGTYFGGVIGAPVVKSDRLRLGFYYAVPLAWDPGSLQGNWDVTTDGTRQSVTYVTLSTLNTYVPGVSAGWRVQDWLRVGASLGWAWTHMTQDQSVTNRILAGPDDTTLVHSILASGETHALRLTLGAQVDAGHGVSVGLKMVAPGLRTGGSANITAATRAFTNTGSVQRTFHDESARFEYPLPLELAGGVAWRGPGAEVELDVRYHAGKGPFPLLSSPVMSEVVTTGDGRPPTSTLIPFTPVTESWRQVINLQVGANARINKAWRVHGGIYTDQSPVSSADSSIFRRVDLVGTSVGVRLSGSHLSGSVGLSASWGTTDSRGLGADLVGGSTSTRLKIRTLTLLYSLAYAF